MLLTLALLLRIAAVLSVGRPWSPDGWFEWVRPVSDSVGYMALSEDLSDGRMDEPSFRTPGYPLFLLATGTTETASPATILAQQLVSLCTALLIWGTVSRLGFSGGGFAALYYMMLPSDIVSAARILPDNLLAATAALAGYLLVRGLTAGEGRGCLLWSYLSGFAVSAATLVKPASLYAAPVVLVPLLLFGGAHRRSVRAGAAALLLVASISGPSAWRAVNRASFGLDAISTQAAFEPMGRVAILSGRVSREEFRSTWADSLLGTMTRDDGTIDWAARDRLFRSIMMEELAREPLRVLIPHVIAWPRIISSNVGSVLFYWGLPASPPRPVSIMCRLLVILYNLLPVAGIGLALLKGRDRPGVRIALMLGLLTWGYTSVILGPLAAAGTRYWLLAYWAVTVAGAAGLDLLLRRRSASRPVPDGVP